MIVNHNLEGFFILTLWLNHSTSEEEPTNLSILPVKSFATSLSLVVTSVFQSQIILVTRCFCSFIPKIAMQSLCFQHQEPQFRYGFLELIEMIVFRRQFHYSPIALAPLVSLAKYVSSGDAVE